VKWYYSYICWNMWFAFSIIFESTLSLSLLYAEWLVHDFFYLLGFFNLFILLTYKSGSISTCIYAHFAVISLNQLTFNITHHWNLLMDTDLIKLLSDGENLTSFMHLAIHLNWKINVQMPSLHVVHSLQVDNFPSMFSYLKQNFHQRNPCQLILSSLGYDNQ